LPDGATPLRSQGWTINSDSGNLAAALPYKLPDGTFGLALIDELKSGIQVSWNWQQEPLAASFQWQVVRRLTHTMDDTLLLFLGQDTAGQWNLVAVQPTGAVALLIGVIPIQDPQTTFVSVTHFSGHPWEFWLVENGVLRLYQWQNDTASLLLDLPGAPQDALTIQMNAVTDITADGLPELWLRWWPWAAKDRWIAAITWQQYYAAEFEGYRLIADLPPSLQFQDVDGDNIGEFLQPDPPDFPNSWIVYDWDGTQFVAASSLSSPKAPVPQVPKLSQLPPIHSDLYFQQGDATYHWPTAGGALETHDPLPAATCNASAITQEVISWSPDCGFAMVQLPAPVEGYTLGLFNVAGGSAFELPNSFTYISGRSTFDWNQASNFVLHARAGDHPGLYRIWLDSGLSEPIFTLSTVEPDPFGVTDPFAFTDGSIGFAIQGADERLYPPFGVYRRLPDGTWQMLANLPALSSSDPENAPYGSLQWSLDGSMFLFHAPFYGGEQPPYSILLIGSADASALFDVNPVLGKASGFVWR
jgi:hypothetical protein